MIVDILIIIIGIVVVLWGADRLTDGAVAVAERMNISQMVIGLTIVAMGTSMPEFCVSFVSALKGTPDLAVGNVVGSNIFNTLFIVGCAAAVMPISILKSTVRIDVPWAILASVLLIVFCIDRNISYLDAAILLAAFLAFMFFTLRNAKKEKDADSAEEEKTAAETPMWKSIMFIVVGLACLIVGSNIFVDAATRVASSLGVSEAVIGLTIVACGTSLPELATSVVAARKGNSGIAIGNVLGSNVFNILMILGITGLICPMQISGLTMVDFAILLGSIVLLWLFSFTKYRVERWEGFVLMAVFLAYIVWLVVNV